jgi:YidC/Oxa1 family membrane protein insertase
MGLVLIAAILVVWGIVTKPSQEELKEAQRKQDSLEIVRQLEQQQAIQDEQQQQQEQKVQGASEDRESANIKNLQSKYGAFAQSGAGEKQIITLENDLLRLEISNKGGRPFSVELKNYKTYDQQPLVLFDGDSTVFGLQFFSQNRTIATNDLFFTPVDTLRSTYNASKREQTARFRLYAGENRYIEYSYTIFPGSYMIDFDMQFMNMGELIPQNLTALDLVWDMYMPKSEKGRDNESQWTSIYYKHHQEEDVEDIGLRSKKEELSEDIPTRLKWIGFKDQFFSSVFIANESFTNGLLTARNFESGKYLKRFTAELGIEYDHFETKAKEFQFYFGPNKYKILKEYDKLQLSELVEMGGGIIRWINKFVIIPIFDVLNNSISNYGIIILLLTIIIKVALFPLTFRSYLSQARMRVLKPQVDEINKKYPAEKAMERQKATMELYRKVGISPMGGCLPMLLQMPILFAMFRFFPTSIELRQESFLWADDLSTYDSIVNLPFEIPFYGDHVSLFTILMTVTTLISIKTNSQMTSSSQMPGMKTMMYIMPFMLLFVLNNFSAGLTYYYFLANVITFGQNAIFKQVIDEDAIKKKLEARKAKPKKKSKFQQRMEEMAKQKGYQTPTKRK